MVSTFLMGSQRVYDFIDDNPAVLMMDVGYTNDPYIISKNDRVTAINSALQVDITGQVCADSLGTKFYSGVGGQIDFIYGASRSEGGKAILAMPSTTNKGISKIAPELTLGAGVVTTVARIANIVGFKRRDPARKLTLAEARSWEAGYACTAFAFTLVIAALTLAAVLPAAAQIFPDKPITMLVPFAAGGTPDILAA